MPSQPGDDMVQVVSNLFKEAGYDVSQEVGVVPGTVDRFATRRTGFERPRTYFEVWPACPDKVEEALEHLEEDRRLRRADRALAVVTDGLLPDSCRTDLEHRTANIITLRRLSLELSGLLDWVRAQVEAYEASGQERSYLRRRGKTSSGEIVDAVTAIAGWLRSGSVGALCLIDADIRGRAAVLNEAIYRLGKELLLEPEKGTLLFETQPEDSGSVSLTVSLGYAAEILWVPWTSQDLSRARVIVPASDRQEAEDTAGSIEIVESIELLDPTADAIERWYKDQIEATATRERFVDAWNHVPGFRPLAEGIDNLKPLLSAVRNSSVDSTTGSLAEWVVHVTDRYVDEVLRGFKQLGASTLRKVILSLAEEALEQFALGRVRDHSPVIPGWLVRAESDGDISGRPYRFANDLLWHYFLAHKIAHEIEKGSTELLTRYQFPRDYVLLFLAIISPEAAAQATAERGEVIREQIEREVERQVELTLAHALNRSVGALSTHMNKVMRRLGREDAADLEYEIRRIEEELRFQRALVDRTRRLHDVPDPVVDAISVHDVARASAMRIHETYPSVEYAIDIDPGLWVLATPDILREILDCMIENAFQALAFADGVAAPRVLLRARAEGDTVRVEVIDNGPGINPDDRERVFRAHVTTKKGGEGKLLGTGMGLPIARRYAERVGGKVGLDPDHEHTCFFALFVAWKEPS